MRCQFCAEEIQDEAVVCRFCGAVKGDGEWRLAPRVAAAPVSQVPTGQFTLRFAAAMFLLSVGFELWCLGDEVPLFGALRGGFVAALYHVVYASMFGALGVGLWTGRRWGYRVVFGATAFYTVERVLFAFDRAGMKAQLTQQLAGYREVLEYVDEDSLLRFASLTALLFVACWWGFAVYVYLRRSYFGVPA